MAALCYPTLPEFSKELYFLEGSHILRRCPSGEINMWMKTSLERWWNGAERGNRGTGREMSDIFTALEINVQKCVDKKNQLDFTFLYSLSFF